MKNIGSINPTLVFWAKLGISMYIMLQLIGMFFTAIGAI